MLDPLASLVCKYQILQSEQQIEHVLFSKSYCLISARSGKNMAMVCFFVITPTPFPSTKREFRGATHKIKKSFNFVPALSVMMEHSYSSATISILLNNFSISLIILQHFINLYTEGIQL